MRTQDEIEVTEPDVEKGETESDDCSRFEDHDARVPWQDVDRPDSRNCDAQLNVTDEGLPIQQHKSGNRIFLRRHVQMMALSMARILWRQS